MDGYVAREENEWDRTRTLMSYIRTFAGMGADRFYAPEEIIGLAKDRLNQPKPIRNYKSAIELLNSFQVN